MRALRRRTTGGTLKSSSYPTKRRTDEGTPRVGGIRPSTQVGISELESITRNGPRRTSPRPFLWRGPFTRSYGVGGGTLFQICVQNDTAVRTIGPRLQNMGERPRLRGVMVHTNITKYTAGAFGYRSGVRIGRSIGRYMLGLRYVSCFFSIRTFRFPHQSHGASLYSGSSPVLWLLGCSL
jgi:hypothetical protein